MTPKTEAIAALDRALSLIPKDGAMTPLDTNLVRSAIVHAGQCVGRIEELKRKRAARKKNAPAGA